MTRSPAITPAALDIQVDGVTRSAFILRGALAAGAVYGLDAVSPFVHAALAQGGGDIDVLNFALTLEHLEATFYERAVQQVKGLSSKTLKLATELRDNERAHVKALRSTITRLGGTPIGSPTFAFGDAFSSPEAFLKTANTFEDTGVSAYNAAALRIRSKQVLVTAGTIVQVEARHAALIRLARGKDPSPLPFDKASSMSAVRGAIKPFITG